MTALPSTPTSTPLRTVIIGGASAMWGDSAIATPQLLTAPRLDYLIYDFLAETTMSILARAKDQSPDLGYATDFVSPILDRHLETIAARGIRVIANAGGLNPLACRDAIARLAEARGLHLTIAAVTGDDVLPLADALRDEDVRGLDGEPFPEHVASANAYLGARPIVEALARGAQIVITGRVVDSALVVGPLVHEFGWSWHDYDRIAQATLAGHVVECGAQATGGLFTDWEQVPGWDNIGYPLIECAADGSFVVTKIPETGGLVVPASVAEQVVYEIGDPSSYVMPDVIADLRAVQVEAIGEQRVRVHGARGRAPLPALKVSATCRDGFQLDSLLAIRGIRAPEKARRTADALLTRTRRQMHEAGFDDYRDVSVELLGCESHYGPHARVHDTREVVLRIAARHRDREALEFLRREAPSSETSMGPGTRGHFGGRATIRPVVRLFSFLLDASRVHAAVHIGRETSPVAATAGGHRLPGTERHEPSERPLSVSPVAEREPGTTETSVSSVQVPLVSLAWARSGDKGDTSNIGVIARTPAIYGFLLDALTADRVEAYMAHLLGPNGRVARFELPGIGALNFLLYHALSGGGMASLRSDPLGKSFGQMLLDMELRVPTTLLGATPPRP